jgi:PAS domain S-box-containing protein
VPDVRTDPDYKGEHSLLLSELAVPVRQGERVLGVLNLESDKPLAFGAEEMRLAESLAEAIALALENARLYQATQIELSERRRVEVTLLATQARLQHLLTYSPTVIYSCEARRPYAVTYVSENVQAQLGHEPVAYLNDARFWTDHIHPQDLQRVLAEVEDLIRDGYHTSEYRFQHKDGDYRWMRDETRLVHDAEGQPIEVIGSWIDITERKQAEEQIRASLQEKEVLLKEIHHRVKNNLQVVSSLLSLQSKEVQDAASLEVLRESQNRVKSMALIHEKLYQSQDLSQVNFADYVRDLTTHLFRTYRANAGVVTLRVIVSDEVRLGVDTAIPCGLIVNELVSNALKHAFPGGRAGEVRVELDRDERNELVLAVSDNGVSFPADMDFRTTGSLGLKLVATLVDQLKGSIQLDRSKGTTFKITFVESPS